MNADIIRAGGSPVNVMRVVGRSIGRCLAVRRTTDSLSSVVNGAGAGYWLQFRRLCCIVPLVHCDNRLLDAATHVRGFRPVVTTRGQHLAGFVT